MCSRRLFCALAQFVVVIEAVVLLLCDVAMAVAATATAVESRRVCRAAALLEDVPAAEGRGITEVPPTALIVVSLDLIVAVVVVVFEAAWAGAVLRSPPRSRPSSTRAAIPIMCLIMGVAGATETTLLLQPPLCICNEGEEEALIRIDISRSDSYKLRIEWGGLRKVL